jgi:calmodulin-lysine N-methyltransferase
MQVLSNDRDDESFEWKSISLPILTDQSVKARFYRGPITLEEMTGFDNTGNVCLWPSEEIMTYFCIKNGIIFKYACLSFRY